MVLMEAPVVMVGTDFGPRSNGGCGPVSWLCPCGGDLAPWGHARERTVRGVGVIAAAPGALRRLRVTHVLLPVSCLLRRADGVEVIGAALLAKAAGAGHRPIAARLGRPASTVRGWLRAVRRHAEAVRAVFTALLVQLGPAGSARCRAGRAVFADAVAAIGGVRCGGPPPARRGRRGVAVAAGGGGHDGGCWLRPGRGVDQHELALGQRLV